VAAVNHGRGVELYSVICVSRSSLDAYVVGVTLDADTLELYQTFDISWVFLLSSMYLVTNLCTTSWSS
jgi:hypothetical protein